MAESTDRQPWRSAEWVEAAERALALARPVVERATHHNDCEDCWYSCSTLTCDDSRKSDVCDCGAAQAIEAKAALDALTEPTP